MFRIELVWNREFHWACHMSEETLDSAKSLAVALRDSGDGERVKKIRIVDQKTDQVVWKG